MSEPPPAPAGRRAGAPRPPEPAAVDVERWQALARAALVAEGGSPDAGLDVTFVDEDEMASLNEEHMGHPGPTDVLSFPLDYADGVGAAVTAGEGDAPPLAGDVVICPAVAARNAPHHAGTLDDELALLVVHGVLHLLGHDHAEPAERAAMQARERALLAELHGPLAGDPWTADAEATTATTTTADPPAPGAVPGVGR